MNFDEMSKEEASEAVLKSLQEWKPKITTHLHHYQVVLGDGFALRYCGLCEKSWMLIFGNGPQAFDMLERKKLGWIEIPEESPDGI